MKINAQAIEISKHISVFVTDYAPTHLTSSAHTLRSYETALSLYVSYLEDVLKISSTDFTSKCFERKILESWLKWLSENQYCSPDTCNYRLSAIRKFITYLSSRDVKYLYLDAEAKGIPLRKTSRKKVNGLSKEAVQTILSEPDTSIKAGVRDETFLVILYATAARLDEILSIQIKNIHIDCSRPYIVISGKGSVVRSLYLLPKAVAHLRHYLHLFHGSSPDPEAFLFYSRNTGIHGKLSQTSIQKMLKKYALSAHERCPDVPLNLHAHQFRHAKATHWLEDGMNITQISLLLGHAQIQTTMVYLDITTEQEFAALSTLENENVKAITPKWNPQSDSLTSLCGLRKASPKASKQ